MPKLKNILIFIVIAVILVLVYIFVFKKSPEQPSLVSTTGNVATTVNVNSNQNENSSISKDFLAVLLNVRNIKIDDAIFSNPAFLSLRDSTIQLVSDGNEGRPNPFAPLGVETSAIPASTPANLIVTNNNNTGTTTTTTTSTTTTTPVMPTMPNVSNTGTGTTGGTVN